MPITLVLLLLVFGALIAAGIPLLLAITSVMTALSLLTIISRWLPVGSEHRRGGADHRDGGRHRLLAVLPAPRARGARRWAPRPGEALRTAAATSGRAIVVSGLTVMIALAGLFLTGYDVFTGIALGTIAVVGVAVLGSLTVLPALLSWLGPRADRGRIPFLGRRRTAARPSRIWAAAGPSGRPPPGGLGWRGRDRAARARRACARRCGSASPAIDLPASSPVLQTIDRVAAGVPADAIARAGGGDRTGRHRPGRCAPRSPRCRPGRRTVGPDGAIHAPITATPVAGGRGLIIDVPLAGNGGDAASNHALLDLAQPCPARDAGPGRRDQLRGGRRHRQHLRRHRGAGLQPPRWWSRS